MSLSSWKERAKLGVLAVAFLFCWGTIWTSFSFDMVGRDLPRLRPSPGICAPDQTLAKTACNDNNKKQTLCQQARRQAQQCQRAVQSAYRRMNAGGCLRDEQQVVLCELEWCNHNDNNNMLSKECQTECQSVRANLQTCIESHIDRSFQTYGLSRSSHGKE